MKAMVDGMVGVVMVVVVVVVVAGNPIEEDMGLIVMMRVM
jgi:hypothetical protein